MILEKRSKLVAVFDLTFVLGILEAAIPYLTEKKLGWTIHENSLYS
jgi:hypothetical protein